MLKNYVGTCGTTGAHSRTIAEQDLRGGRVGRGPRAEGRGFRNFELRIAPFAAESDGKVPMTKEGTCCSCGKATVVIYFKG